MSFLANSNSILQISHAKTFKKSILYLGASAIILSKDIDKYAFMCGSNFYESDVIIIHSSTNIGKCKIYF